MTALAAPWHPPRATALHASVILLSAAAAAALVQGSQLLYVLAGVAGLALILQRPMLRLSQLGLFAAILSLQYSTFTIGPLDGAAAQKLLVVLLFALPVLRFGVDRRYLMPVLALASVFLLTFVSGHSPGRLPVFTVISAFAGLSLAWVVLSVRWPAELRRPLLRTVALLPIASVSLQMVLNPSGLFRDEYFSGVARLQGINIPAHLASIALVGVFAAAVEWYLHRRRVALMLVLVDAVIVCMTVTRVTVLALLPLLLPLAVTLVRRMRRRSLALGWLMLATVLIGAIAFVTVGPRLVGRSFNERTQQTGESIDATGRAQAWGFYVDQIKESPWTGQGLGAATFVNESGDSAILTVPHNEFLHFLLDGGVVGGSLIIGAIVVTYGRVRRAAVPVLRPLVGGMLVGLLFMSLVHNPISSVQFTVPLACVLALCRASADHGTKAAGELVGAEAHG